MLTYRLRGERFNMKNIDTYPPKIKAAIDQVLVASAAWRAAEETDKESKNKVLSENVFVICTDHETRATKNGDRITDYKIDFLMSDSDFEKYCQLVYEENLKAGLDSGGVGLTFWHLRKAVIDAENALIDTVAADIPQYTPEIIKKVKTHPNLRKNFLKITFGESYKA
jgi:hypothetical protein